MKDLLWSEAQGLKLLVARLAIALFLLQACRFWFYGYNFDYFAGASAGEMTGIFLYAFRFDLSSALYVNLPFIAAMLVASPLQQNRWYKRLVAALFFLPNLFMMGLELADSAYFPHSFRRIVRSDFDMQQDIANMLDAYVRDFWPLMVYGLGIFVVAILLYRSTKYIPQNTDWKRRNYLFRYTLFPIYSALIIIGLRGGIQDRPLMSMAAAQYVQNLRFSPLVTNATLNMIHSFQQRLVASPRYLTPEQLALYPTIREYLPDSAQPMRRLNVVIVALESYGKEYICRYHRGMGCLTPLFDSLLAQSLVFEEAYANGTRSTQGIVALTGGLPVLMQDPFMFSAYQNHRLTGLGGHLKREGYKTGFFHGGNNGTMNFDTYTKIVGIDDYHGRREYEKAHPEARDYDGNWGVWDEPFLQYAIEELHDYPQPFFATIFTINPHHPYNLPASFPRPAGEDPLLSCVRYSDMALRRFFEQAAREAWYQNTLFVLSADHIGSGWNPAFRQKSMRYQIPIALFCPSDSSLRGSVAGRFQQIDVLPTVLRYLRYPHAFRAFGLPRLDSAYAKLPNFAYKYDENLYQIISDSFVLHFNGEQTTGFFEHPRDTFFQQNLLGQRPEAQQKLENQLKALIQTHHEALLNNVLP